MALVRVIALAAVAACDPAGAQPGTASGLTTPAGWTALPELASATAAAAKDDGVTVEGSEAWGEPGRGCYAVWLALRGERATGAAVLDGLTAQGFTTTDVVKPETDDGVVSLAFDKPPFHGRVRAKITAGRVVAVACFANDREPATCDAPCLALLGSLP